jgi:hypothetical protein
MVLDRLAEPDEQVATDLGMGELATAELDGNLHAVPVLQELDRAPDLRIEVAHADLRLEPDFLEGDRALLSLGFLLALGELVLVLPEVEEPDDRRRRHRGDLDEVEPPLLRKSKGLVRGQHPPLVPLFVDDPDLWDTDHLIYAQVSADVSPLVAGSYPGLVGTRIPRDRAVAAGRLAQPFDPRQRCPRGTPRPLGDLGEARVNALRAAGCGPRRTRAWRCAPWTSCAPSTGFSPDDNSAAARRSDASRTCLHLHESTAVCVATFPSSRARITG